VILTISRCMTVNESSLKVLQSIVREVEAIRVQMARTCDIFSLHKKFEQGASCTVLGQVVPY